jgi:PilZ domain-containing protein
MSPVVESMQRRYGRIYVRIPVNIALDSEDGRTSHEAATIDLSVSGARVATNTPLVPGEQVRLDLSKEHRLIASRVIWSVQLSPDAPPESGLQFLQPLEV